jgi:hypothetical protein
MALSLVLLIILWLPSIHPGTTTSTIQEGESNFQVEKEALLMEKISESMSSPTFLTETHILKGLFLFNENSSLLILGPFFSVLLMIVVGVSAWVGSKFGFHQKEEIMRENCPMSPISICSTSIPSVCSPKSLDLNEPGLGMFSWNDIGGDLTDTGSYSRNFDEIKLLWENDFETVHVARHKLDMEEYLVKAIPLTINLENGIKDSQLFQEISKIKKINCRHVARYVTCWVEESKPFDLDSATQSLVLFVQMELIQGESLSSLLSSSISKSQGLKIIRQVCKIVNYLHSHSLAHGDLSTENIFINKYGSVMIGDFNMKNCFCDDQRSILELVRSVIAKVGTSESILYELMKIPFIRDSGLSEKVDYVLRNLVV